MFSCEFCEISKNTFYYGQPSVAASEASNLVSGYVLFSKYSCDFRKDNSAQHYILEKRKKEVGNGQVFGALLADIS